MQPRVLLLESRGLLESLRSPGCRLFTDVCVRGVFRSCTPHARPAPAAWGLNSRVEPRDVGHLEGVGREGLRARAGALSQLGELVQHPEDEPWEKKGVAPNFRGPAAGLVRFQNVSFAYPTRPGYQVLRSLTMDVPAKQVLGLMGHSGSGRTTMASLLLRRLRPTGGVIWYATDTIRPIHMSSATQLNASYPSCACFPPSSPVTEQPTSTNVASRTAF